jgi:hypothetical protein
MFGVRSFVEMKDRSERREGWQVKILHSINIHQLQCFVACCFSFYIVNVFGLRSIYSPFNELKTPSRNAAWWVVMSCDREGYTKANRI